MPGVGTIKEYPATGLMTGCGNLYFYKAGQQNSRAANYVFLSRGDGSHAWMNLNGRDVLLRQIKSAARGKQKHGRAILLLAQLAQHTQPVQLGQHDVEHNAVEDGCSSRRERFITAMAHVHGKALRLQRLADERRGLFFIFHDQHAHRATSQS